MATKRTISKGRRRGFIHATIRDWLDPIYLAHDELINLVPGQLMACQLDHRA
jgi:hypothetical protein